MYTFRNRVFLPGHHLAERLIVHVASAVAPLPLVLLPVEQAADPLDRVRRIVVQHVPSKPAVLQLDGLGQLAVPVFAVKVRVQPVHFRRRHVVALLADALKVRRAQCVHAFDACHGRCRCCDRAVVVVVGAVVVAGSGSGRCELSKRQECCGMGGGGKWGLSCRQRETGTCVMCEDGEQTVQRRCVHFYICMSYFHVCDHSHQYS